MICFIVTTKPRSFNNWSRYDSKGQAYMQTVTATFVSAHPTHQKLNGDLYGVIYYFYKEDRNHDADNISKPVWDCLTDVMYVDDKQVRVRVAGVFNLKRHDIQTLDLSTLPGPVFSQLLDAMDNHDHFFYVECGPLHMRHYKFNLEVK